MSATADKARYFLEQSVPELKEYERKKIFNSDEITSMARKRSDFEHKINARGSKPSDYAQYAEFEINVDTLRRARVKRMGIKSVAHNGQRRIFFVFDRGTRKFPGDMGLWMQSIEYARRQKAYKKLMQMFTTVLRLHPTRSDLWIYAAQFAIDENGDMTEARSYMQRGLRLCKNVTNLWIEYARLELAYMAKIHARRKILGVGVVTDVDEGKQLQDEENGVLKLPKVTANDLHSDNTKSHAIDEEALSRMQNTPVMSGALPRAIFDAAMANFNHDVTLGRAFFDLIAEFCHISETLQLLDDVLDSLQTHHPTAWQTQACHVSRPLLGLSHDQSDFVPALRDTFARIRHGLARTQNSKVLLDWYQGWLRSWLHPDIDPALQQVISGQSKALRVEFDAK